MKILHVISGQGRAAGTTTFVENVAAGLRVRGHDVDVCERIDVLGNGRRPDVVHIHGLWLSPLHKASVWARQNGVPVVWSTHGMSSPWSMRHKRWKKAAAWHLYQRRDLSLATAIHCTTDLEAEWNRRLGLGNCFVAPLGTKLPETRLSVDRAELHSDRLRVLFVGRIYPVKGLVNLVKAAALLPRHAARFRIVGPDQAGHMAELVRLADALGVGESFEWVGPKYGDALEDEYNDCDLLALPSFTENFGGVVVEALAHGKPVIASRLTPWKTLEDERCGWWVDNGPESLAATLREAIGCAESGETLAMGERGRKLVEARYTWTAVCDSVLQGYENAVGRNAKGVKVLNVVSGIRPATGGLAQSTQGLVSELFKAGVDAWICPFDEVKPWIAGVRKLDARWLGSKAGGVKNFDLVHLHGIWDWRLHRVAVKCRRAGVPYVVSPRGMLEPWSLKQKWLKKRIARWLYQDRDLRLAAALHATAESEAEQFRRLGFVNEIVVSPNGVNVPDSLPQKGDAGGVRRVLFVSRMHPKKGVLELVESWARVKKAVEAKGGRWICELVYTVDGAEEAAYEQKVRRRVHELGLDGQFVFTGALDDKKKWEAYARADLFVLPTYSENFGIVVAEALWAGVPVITTKGAPWSELEGKDLRSNGRPAEQSGNFRCGWWIDLPPTDSLDAALREAMTTPDLRELGERGHRLVARRYTWPAVCDAMVRGYARIAEARGRTGGERGKSGEA